MDEDGVTVAVGETDAATPHRIGHGLPGRSGPPGNANARTHGTHALQAAPFTGSALVPLIGAPVLGRRSPRGAPSCWTISAASTTFSTQEFALVEEAVKTKLILDSVDAWLLSQPTLINKRLRAVLRRSVIVRRS